MRIPLISLILSFTANTFAIQNSINFTLATNNVIDSGLTYTNQYSGSIGPENSFVIGFEIAINSVNGNSVNIDPLAAFCSEIAEPISPNNTYTFNAGSLSELVKGTAGQGASSNINPGGIGDLRAARLQYFFDQYYSSVDLTGWSQIDLHAFQLGVWEITHDTDLDLSNNNGSHYFGNQTGSGNGFRKDVVDQSQIWLDNVAYFNPTVGYTSNQYKFWALTDDGSQDVILASLIGSPTQEILEEYIVIPELSSIVYLGIVGLIIVTIRKSKHIH